MQVKCAAHLIAVVLLLACFSSTGISAAKSLRRVLLDIDRHLSETVAETYVKLNWLELSKWLHELKTNNQTTVDEDLIEVLENLNEWHETDPTETCDSRLSFEFRDYVDELYPYSLWEPNRRIEKLIYDIASAHSAACLAKIFSAFNRMKLADDFGAVKHFFSAYFVSPDEYTYNKKEMFYFNRVDEMIDEDPISYKSNRDELVRKLYHYAPDEAKFGPMTNQNLADLIDVYLVKPCNSFLLKTMPLSMSSKTALEANRINHSRESQGYSWSTMYNFYLTYKLCDYYTKFEPSEIADKLKISG